MPTELELTVVQVCYTTDKQMGYPCEINVVDSRNFNPDETVFKVAIPTGGPKVTDISRQYLQSTHLCTSSKVK